MSEPHTPQADAPDASPRPRLLDAARLAPILDPPAASRLRRLVGHLDSIVGPAEGLLDYLVANVAALTEADFAMRGLPAAPRARGHDPMLAELVFHRTRALARCPGFPSLDRRYVYPVLLAARELSWQRGAAAADGRGAEDVIRAAAEALGPGIGLDAIAHLAELADAVARSEARYRGALDALGVVAFMTEAIALAEARRLGPRVPTPPAGRGAWLH